MGPADARQARRGKRPSGRKLATLEKAKPLLPMAQGGRRGGRPADPPHSPAREPTSPSAARRRAAFPRILAGEEAGRPSAAKAEAGDCNWPNGLTRPDNPTDGPRVMGQPSCGTGTFGAGPGGAIARQLRRARRTARSISRWLDWLAVRFVESGWFGQGDAPAPDAYRAPTR